MNPAGRGDSSCFELFAEELQVWDTPDKALQKAYRDFSWTKSSIVVRTLPQNLQEVCNRQVSSFSKVRAVLILSGAEG